MSVLISDKNCMILASVRDSEKSYVEKSLARISTGTGDPVACERLLGNYAEVEALFQYFDGKSLLDLRYWLYVAAKIQLHQLPHNHRFGYPTLRFWRPLFSNHSGLIEHVARFPEQYPLDAGRDLGEILETREKPLHDNHQRWVRQLAIRGEWDRVQAQTALALANPPKSVKSYVLTDMQYLQALASGDVATMEACLAELLKPRIRKARNDLPILEDLLSLDVLVLAKIAWMHGYEIDPKSNYVPSDWLPMTPNASYVDPWDFMKDIVLP
ncbi:Imm49 family immunity protein [Jeongeupia chitinilytica]|uniref:Uncharacterized protein n=1 Tax=Jeongeupia chitinilytica TaxID=1041641 RepID=A0ABQ3GYN5_9NEIS|nr:Imm49 family immunity protein [Jeongeupia chitinilytica]GHD57865.1 hypothetical protein GCM10007350_06810 [Jeongeupia chitinilytica]